MEKLPYLIKTVTRHGKVAYYVWRRPGRKIRIRGEYGSRAFKAAYRAALYGETPDAGKKVAPGSLAELIQDYRKSGAWAALADASRKTRDQVFKTVEKAAADVAVAAIDREMIIATREKAGSPATARNILTTLRALFKWAVEVGRLEEDPTAGVAIPAPRKGKGYPTWSDADIAAYRARWAPGTRQRLWMEVLLHTGLRRGDATRLKWADIVDGVIHLTTQKTGTPVILPVTPDLEAVFAAGPRGRVYVIEGVDGAPFTPESFSVVFWKACRAAGVRASAHGLRKAGTTAMAYAGATVPELNAARGWTGSKMALRYIEEAERARLAKQAYDRLKSNKKDEPKGGGGNI